MFYNILKLNNNIQFYFCFLKMFLIFVSTKQVRNFKNKQNDNFEKYKRKQNIRRNFKKNE